MGRHLRAEAETACQAGDLPLSARFVLYLLADRGNDATRLAWRGQAWLRDVTSLSRNGVPSAVALLDRTDRISVWRRPGKVPLYLVHPLGRRTLLPFDRTAMLAHLSDGQFSPAEQEQACAWRASLDSAGAGKRQRRAPSDPPTEWGGGQDTSADTPPAIGGHPPSHWGATPPLSGAEQERNRKGTGKPACGPWPAGEPDHRRAGSYRRKAWPGDFDLSKPPAELVADLLNSDTAKGAMLDRADPADRLALVAGWIGEAGKAAEASAA